MKSSPGELPYRLGELSLDRAHYAFSPARCQPPYLFLTFLGVISPPVG